MSIHGCVTMHIHACSAKDTGLEIPTTGMPSDVYKVDGFLKMREGRHIFLTAGAVAAGGTGWS